MRRFVLYPLSSVTTFAIGLSVVWFALSMRMPDSRDVNIDIARSPVTFTETGRGCGNGYVQGYETNDERSVSEGVVVLGSKRKARAAIQDEIGENTVVEHIREYTGYNGTGERYVLLLEPFDGPAVKILFYDGGDNYSKIYAPDLPLALKFEQYLADEAARLAAEAKERSTRTF